MSTLEIVLTVAVVYLAGMVAVLLIDSKLAKDELAFLAVWPLAVPLFSAIRAYRHWAYTCSDCGGYYGDRKRYKRHLVVRYHCTAPPADAAEAERLVKAAL